MANIFELFDKIKTGKSKQGPPEYLVVGLGNPGKKYEGTRHNVGFVTLDAMAQQFGVSVTRSKFDSLTGSGTIGGKQCLLMKPQTYMNNSGTAVQQAADYYKVPPEHILVIYDDISLEPSQMRIRRKGTHGGHNGIRSIIDWLDTEEFPRIKIGVGKKPHPGYDLADWVLSNFTAAEKEKIQEVAKQAIEAAELIVQGKIDEAMNRFN